MKTRIFAMTGCLALFAAASAFAETGDILTADVPFEFHVGGTVLPAGHYEVVPQTVPNLLEIRSSDSKAEVMVAVQVIQTATKPDAGALVFHRFGRAYFLSNIRNPDSSEEGVVTVPGAGREVAANGPAAPSATAALATR